MSRSEREQDLEEKIRYQLHATGERDRLKTLLAAKLESSGWKDEIKARTKEFVEKQGKDTKDLTVDDIVKAVRPQGRALVPDSVKAELLAEIKRFILSL